MSKEVRLCVHCNKELRGCPCNWRKTSDGGLAHKECVKEYEKNKNHTKPTCAYCGVPFNEPAYFKGMDGRDVHFKCHSAYDKELLKNKK